MEYQRKTEKQLTDSMKIVFWSTVACFGMFVANIICDFIF
jgi:hypothetical protein